VALWIFSFFIGFASELVADALAPVKNPRDPKETVANRRVADAASGSSVIAAPTPAQANHSCAGREKKSANGMPVSPTSQTLAFG
jgi:hypothetical protein